MNYYSSDWHLNHTNIITFADRPFSSTEEMNMTILNNVTSILKKGDKLYFLGDFSKSKSMYDLFFSMLPKGVEFHWIIGNHDKGLVKQYGYLCTSVSYMKEVIIQGNPTTLCHYPMISWNKSHYGAFQLYGHHHHKEGKEFDAIHDKILPTQLNVNCEFHDYKPWSENQIVAYMKESMKDMVIYD